MASAITFSVDMSAFANAMNALPEEMAKESRNAIKEGAAILVSAARTEYLAKTRTHSKNGNKVEKSIQEEIAPDGMSGRVFINSEVAPHAVFVHEGTEDHIVPKSGHVWGKGTMKGGEPAALHFVLGGESYFSKGHKVTGLKPDQFLYRAADKSREKIISMVEEKITTAIHTAGF